MARHAALREALDELVTANRILAREGIVDAFGHASVRHPDRPDRFFLSRARAPGCIEAEDLLEITLDGTVLDADGRPAYAERFIHAAVYEARPDVRAVIHNHSPSVIPFGVTSTPLRPLLHMAASMGTHVPLWDSQTRFGDTNLLVTNVEMARDLALTLGRHAVVLMRGHGCTVAGGSLRETVFNAIYLELNAALQLQAHSLEARGLGGVTFLSDGEISAVLKTRSAFTFERAWEHWCHRAGRPYDARPLTGPLAG